MRSRLLLAIGFTVVAALAFVAGSSTTKANPPALEIRPGSGHWLQVWRDGELSSEWQPADGRIFMANVEFGVTMLLVEHKVRKVFSIADWIVGLRRGEIIEQGRPETFDGAGLKDLFIG